MRTPEQKRRRVVHLLNQMSTSIYKTVKKGIDGNNKKMEDEAFLEELDEVLADLEEKIRRIREVLDQDSS